MKATVVVGNPGDGRAPRSKLFLFLVSKKGPPKPIGSRKLSRLPRPGGEGDARASAAERPEGQPVSAPALVKPGKSVKQYGRGNDAGLSAGTILAGS